jgi:peptidyl-tRNA hydrolase
MLLAEADAVPDHPWAGSINRWLRGRIRKVSRRARGVAWTRVCELPGVTATVGSAQVRALVPCPMDAVAPEVKKLQVQGLVTAGVLPIAAPPGFDGLVISVNPDFTLSPGKAAAQVAHASNVAWMEAAVADRNAWRDRGFPLCVVRPDPANFATVARRAPISIRDAGFTEIPAGSLTCVASWSGP